MGSVRRMVEHGVWLPRFVAHCPETLGSRPNLCLGVEWSGVCLQCIPCLRQAISIKRQLALVGNSPNLVEMSSYSGVSIQGEPHRKGNFGDCSLRFRQGKALPLLSEHRV